MYHFLLKKHDFGMFLVQNYDTNYFGHYNDLNKLLCIEFTRMMIA